MLLKTLFLNGLKINILFNFANKFLKNGNIRVSCREQNKGVPEK